MSFIVAANWKMFKTPIEAETFFHSFLPQVESLDEKTKVILFVPAVNAWVSSLQLKGTKVSWGPQNIYPAKEGAFTGENSPSVMAEIGATYALIGHSERRSLFGESNDQTNVKIKSVQEFGLSPILCVGESLEERKSGKTIDVLKTQLSEGLKDIEIKKELHIAYEPVWAIGTGEVATTAQVSEAHQFIRQFLQEKFADKASKINILYGGSVKPENSSELSTAKEVGGFLVGGASLKVDSFYSIIEAVTK